MPWAPGRVRVMRRAGGPCAFVMLELFLNTLRHSPGSGASQLALSCLQISPARPIFLCCLWHRLENLLQVLFALTLPVPSCSHSVGFPALGEAVCGQHSGPPLTSCHWVMSRCSQTAPGVQIPPAASHRLRCFPSLPSEMSPSWTPSCCHSAVLRAVTSTGPLRTRGSLANVTAGQAGAGTGLPPGSASPCRVGTRPCSPNAAPSKERADPFPSSTLARSRIRAGQWRDSPLLLHLIFCLLFWTPRFEPVPNEAKINFLSRCHKYSTWEEGAVLTVTAVSESHVLYLAFHFPCAAAASSSDSSDKALCCSPDPCSRIPRIPRIRVLVRGRAELSKGFFCLMQTQNYLGRDLFEGWKKCPARSSEWRGAGRWLRCGAGPVENGYGIFPSLPWAQASVLVPGR